MEVVSYAVIAAHNRQTYLNNLVDVLVGDNVTTVVIDNASNPPITVRKEVYLIHDSEQPPNLSRIWNRGLGEVLLLHTLNHGDKDFVVCVLNDDLEIYPGFIPELVEDLRSKNVALSSPSDDNGRITGWCFAMRGSLVTDKKLWFDESLRWWYGDILIYHKAKRLPGGVSGFTPRGKINHIHPNKQTTESMELRKQCALDEATYHKIMKTKGWM